MFPNTFRLQGFLADSGVEPDIADQELKRLDSFSGRIMNSGDTLCHADALDAEKAVRALGGLFGKPFAGIETAARSELAEKDRREQYRAYRVADRRGLHRLLRAAAPFDRLWRRFVTEFDHDGRNLKDIIRSSVGSDTLQAKFDDCRFGHDLSGIFVDDIVAVWTLYFACLVTKHLNEMPYLSQAIDLLAATRSVGWHSEQPDKWLFMVK